MKPYEMTDSDYIAFHTIRAILSTYIPNLERRSQATLQIIAELNKKQVGPNSSRGSKLLEISSKEWDERLDRMIREVTDATAVGKA